MGQRKQIQTMLPLLMAVTYADNHIICNTLYYLEFPSSEGFVPGVLCAMVVPRCNAGMNSQGQAIVCLDGQICSHPEVAENFTCSHCYSESLMPDRHSSIFKLHKELEDNGYLSCC